MGGGMAEGQYQAREFRPALSKLGKNDETHS
jgi:hypothetical protein